MQPAGSYYIQLSEQAKKQEHNLHSGNKAGNDPEHFADIIHGSVSGSFSSHNNTDPFMIVYARRYQRA